MLGGIDSSGPSEISLLLFAGHDPGAKNHIRPIHQRAMAEGNDVEILDLMARVELLEYAAATEFIGRRRPSLLVAGCSMDQRERPLVQACKSLGIPAVSVVDISTKGKFDGWPPESMPDQFLVTNQGCVDELTRMGVDPQSVVLVGSAHFEDLARTSTIRDRDAVMRHYGVANATTLVSFFCVPSCADSVAGVNSLGVHLPGTQLESATVIIRPHPRMPEKPKLDKATSRFHSFIFDGQDAVATPDLLSASLLSLSMASTVSLESLAMGVPSAFYQIGWDHAYHDDLYSNIEGVTRIRDAADLSKFIDRSWRSKRPRGEFEVENCWGALERTWNALQAVKSFP